MKLGFQERAVIVIAVVVFGGLGTYYARMGVVRIQEGLASRSWPAIGGIVTSAEVTAIESRPTRPQQVTYGRSWFASVHTRYIIDGMQFESDRITLDESQHFFRFLAELAIRPYPRDAHVVVYYDPADPTRAVLEPGLTLGVVAPLFFGVAIVLGILFFAKLMLFPRSSSASTTPEVG
jgi:hypothetical protein